MNFRQAFRPNGPTVVSEAFDDEIVIIHLESGAYYSLAQSGAVIWQLLQQGNDLTEITGKLGALYRIGPTELTHTLSPFISELLQERLIVPVTTSSPPIDGVSHNTLGQRVESVDGGFTPPVLQKFTDMQDLLLLDPIHEVDSAGWPMRK